MQFKVTPALRLKIIGDLETRKHVALFVAPHVHPGKGKPALNPRHGHTQVETHRKRRRADAETDSDRRRCLSWRSRASGAHMAVFRV